MKWYNVHHTNNDVLQRLLNDHVLKGYDLHHVRGVQNKLVVTFVKDLTESDWQKHYAAQERRHKELQERREASASTQPATSQAKENRQPTSV